MPEIVRRQVRQPDRMHVAAESPNQLGRGIDGRSGAAGFTERGSDRRSALSGAVNGNDGRVVFVFVACRVIVSAVQSTSPTVSRQSSPRRAPVWSAAAR
jgi:hypothetical protein